MGLAKCYLCSVTFIGCWYTNVTSQVWQRPQQASVVMRSPLQPGFWATKENSRTAQPLKPWSVLVMATHTTAVPATRRMIKEWCMLGMMGRGKKEYYLIIYIHSSASQLTCYPWVGSGHLKIEMSCFVMFTFYVRKHLIVVKIKKWVLSFSLASLDNGKWISEGFIAIILPL